MKQRLILLVLFVGLWAQPVSAADRTVFVDGTTSGTPGTNGAHYASLDAAIDGEVAAAPNLVGDSAILHIECSTFSGSAADTAPVDVTGFTTDSTHYVRIYTAAGSRNAGTWDASKYRLEVANPAAHVMLVRQEYTRIEGMQIRKTASNANDQMVLSFVSDSAANFFLSESIIRSAPADAFRGVGVWVADSDVTLYAWNNIVYGFPDVASVYNTGIMAEVGTSYSYSNTIIGGFYGAYTGVGATLNCKNSYFAETSTDGSAASIANAGTFNDTTCAVSDGDTDVGASLRNIAVDTTTFTNVTGGSENFLLPGTGSPLYNVGTNGPDLTPLNFTTDITGLTRTSTWDIGADEVNDGAAATVQSRTLMGVGK